MERLRELVLELEAVLDLILKAADPLILIQLSQEAKELIEEMKTLTE